MTYPHRSYVDNYYNSKPLRITDPFPQHHCLLIHKPKLKEQKYPKTCGAFLSKQANQFATILHLSDVLSVWIKLISILDSSSSWEGHCVLAGKRMACLRLDASCKQVLMSPAVELCRDEVFGFGQTSQKHYACVLCLLLYFYSMSTKCLHFLCLVSSLCMFFLHHTYIILSLICT